MSKRTIAIIVLSLLLSCCICTSISYIGWSTYYNNATEEPVAEEPAEVETEIEAPPAEVETEIEAPPATCTQHGQQAHPDINNEGTHPLGGLDEPCWIVAEVNRGGGKGTVLLVEPYTVAWINSNEMVGMTAWFVDTQSHEDAILWANDSIAAIKKRDGHSPNLIDLASGDTSPLINRVQTR